MTRRLLTRAALFLISLLVLMPAQAMPKWGMNDVTLIYPLPHYPHEASQLISPQTEGLGGPLLPSKYFHKLPAINQGESGYITYQNLRVVAIRIDPCFSSQGECLRQVRLVWQPLNKSSYGSSTRFGLLEAKDAAIHSLYTLNPDDFQALLDDYAELRQTHGRDLSNEPLQVHPILSGLGLSSHFAQGLKELITTHIGEENLWRVTAMSTFVGGDQWTFQGFNIREDETPEIIIPRTQGATQQRFSTSLLNTSEFNNGQLTPVPVGSDNLQTLLGNSRHLPSGSSLLIRELGASIARIENPDIHTPETMDCVSCHAAQTAGSVLFNRFTWLKNDPKQIESSFSRTQSSTNPDTQRPNTQVLRALGYFERHLILSRRVLNETARVVERLNGKA